MKRTILALALAGVSVAAYAARPPGAGTPTVTNVNVTNPSLTVDVANQPISVVTPVRDIADYAEMTGAKDVSSNMTVGSTVGIIAADSVLQGFTIDLDASPATPGASKCTARIYVADSNSYPIVQLGIMSVRAGQRDSRYQPVNLRIPAGLILRSEIENQTDKPCTFAYHFDLVSAQ